ncbi:RICIN domain-containing protein [Sorangium sp. So ce834]|uniref:RICIN domain-containing protein n=1 Tax=Sorangium sp. So ce834 TaxID=3133321 RepID=UPI003F60A119
MRGLHRRQLRLPRQLPPARADVARHHAVQGRRYDGLAARHSGKCLDVVSGSTADGAAVKQFACNGGSNQQGESW